MKTKISVILTSTLLMLFSCGHKQEQVAFPEEGAGGGAGFTADVEYYSEPEEVENTTFSYSPPKPSAQVFQKFKHKVNGKNGDSDDLAGKKKIIKDGSMSVKSKEIESSKKRIDDLLKKLNAYYDGEDLENNDEMISYNLKIRVPAENFEKLIAGIESGKDEIITKSINAQDVTEEYTDIEGRLANKREYLKRYKDLLSKAATVKDILAIEENIRVLQEEIESKEGRLKYLSDQVAFSTLNLNVFKEKDFVYKPQPEDKFSERVKTSLSRGWTAVVDFILWVITVWPQIIITLLVIYLIRRFIRKRRSKKAD